MTLAFAVSISDLVGITSRPQIQPSVAHHPRLGRGSVPYDPRPCPQGDEPGRSRVHRRNGAATRRHCWYYWAARSEQNPNTPSLLSMASLGLTQVAPTNSRMLVDVRFKSDSEVELADADFRFTPESGHPVGGLGCPKSANSGLG
jgi:hypothetical protein